MGLSSVGSGQISSIQKPSNFKFQKVYQFLNETKRIYERNNPGSKLNFKIDNSSGKLVIQFSGKPNFNLYDLQGILTDLVGQKYKDFDCQFFEKSSSNLKMSIQ